MLYVFMSFYLFIMFFHSYSVIFTGVSNINQSFPLFLSLIIH